MNSNHALSRRQFFHGLGVGLGTLALNSLLQGESRAAGADLMLPRAGHLPAKARACIMIFLEGGPSHIDTFDPKPKLKEMDGQEFKREGKFVSNMAGGKRYFVPSSFGFQQHGQSGLSVCDHLPHIGSVADDLCVYKGLTVESVNHPEACLHFNTGSRFGGEPAFGAWTTYGLGTENQNLPAFVVLPEAAPQGGPANWTNGYLPAHFQGTPLRSGAAPILDLQPRAGVTPEHQRRTLALLQKLDGDFQRDHPLQDRLQARLASYDLAFRMQTTVPELVQLDRESESVRSLYGIGEKATDSTGRKCLLARRLVESGVRFVQIINNGWDSHDDVDKNLGDKLTEVDRPIAGLIKDLKSRGLLDSTLVLVCGEFGRLPDNGMRKGKVVRGRDHNPDAMSIVLAGGGVKAGHTIGATDDIGGKAVECVHHLRDFHVTLLRLLGLDDSKLTYFHSGRFKQLSQIGGQPIQELIA